MPHRLRTVEWYRILACKHAASKNEKAVASLARAYRFSPTRISLVANHLAPSPTADHDFPLDYRICKATPHHVRRIHKRSVSPSRFLVCHQLTPSSQNNSRLDELSSKVSALRGVTINIYDNARSQEVIDNSVRTFPKLSIFGDMRE